MASGTIIAALCVVVLFLCVITWVLARRLHACRSTPLPAQPTAQPTVDDTPAPNPQPTPDDHLGHEVQQREKLAALGQLVAGVAHELNTPMGAIKASASNLDAVVDRVLTDLPRALEELGPDNRPGFLNLVRDALQTRFAPMTSRQERRLRRSLARQLADAGVADPDPIARTLSEMGALDDLGPHLDLLTRPEALDLVELANELVSLRRNTDNIRTASERAGKIVFALKTYAHPGGAQGKLFEGAIADDLDTVLTLYHNQLKQGYELVRRYDEAGHVLARHDELNQVWVNLIHNAMQAMGGHGTLTVGIHEEAGDRVRVDIGDDGPGIDADILHQVFEPFFTTKAAGEGSGLGLAICQDIVAAHNGTITVRSKPGDTVFSVTLPRAPRGDAAG